MKRWLGLVVLAACADPLKEAQLLEEPRVLGVRVTTASDQASPAPGESATFEVLLAGPDGTLDARLSYQLCEAARSTRGVPFCERAPFAEDTIALNGAGIAIDLPNDLTGEARLALLAVACLTSEPRSSDEPLDWGCAGGEAPLRLSFDVRPSSADFTNYNPDLSALSVSIGGVDVPVDELSAAASCEASAPVVAAGATLQVSLDLGAQSDADEELQLSHFSNSGSFERQYSFVEREQRPEAALTWRAPAAGTPVKQYLVARDGRGGVSWASWNFCTR